MHSTGSATSLIGNRSQTVFLDGEESGSVQVNIRCGSVLGPILSFIYFNDLPDELAYKVRLFTNYTVVYLTIGGEDDSNILQDLDRPSLWDSRWDMEFNPSKCQVVHVTTSWKTSNFSYIPHGHVLGVSCARYIGVTLYN